MTRDYGENHKAQFFRCPLWSVMTALPASHCQYSLPHASWFSSSQLLLSHTVIVLSSQNLLQGSPNVYILVLKLAGAVVAGKWRFSLLSTLLYSLRRVSTEFTALLLFSGDCQFTNFYILKAIYITNQSRRQTNTFKWDTITTIKKEDWLQIPCCS